MTAVKWRGDLTKRLAAGLRKKHWLRDDFVSAPETLQKRARCFAAALPRTRWE